MWRNGEFLRFWTCNKVAYNRFYKRRFFTFIIIIIIIITAICIAQNRLRATKVSKFVERIVQKALMYYVHK